MASTDYAGFTTANGALGVKVTAPGEQNRATIATTLLKDRIQQLGP